MDLVIELLAFIFQALAGDGKAKSANAPKPVPVMQRVEQETRAKVQARQASALQPPLQAAGPDAAFRNTGWCLAGVLLAFLLAVAAGAVLLIYALGG